MNKYLFSILLIELLAVSVYDFYKKIIPNKVILINIVFFFIVFLIDPEKKYLFNYTLILFPVAFIAVGFLLFKLNIMGAGDSKLLASLFLFIPVNLQYTYLDYLMYTTVLVGSIFFFSNALANIKKILCAFKKRDKLLLKGIWGTKFPFAPVIIISWVWFGWNLFLKK